MSREVELWPAMHFDGETYNHSRDSIRLTGQMLKVYSVIKDGCWHTLPEIARQVGGSEAGVSARLRDFRKPRFGGYEVSKEYVSNGLWKYRLEIDETLET